MTRKSFRHQGQAYSLSHLEPHTVSAIVGSDSVVVRVEYRSHVFTRAYDQASDKPDLVHAEHGERRAFCFDRYSDSLDIPQLTTKAIQDNLPAFLSRDRNGAENYFILDDPKGANPLRAYFQIERSKQRGRWDVVLIVRSAYRKGPISKRPEKSKVHTLVRKAMSGKQKRPRRA